MRPKPLPTRLVVGAVALTLLVLGAVPVGADTPQEKLDEIDRRIQAIAAEMEKTQGTRSQLAVELAATEARMGQLRSQLHTAEDALAAIVDQLDATRLQIADTEARIDDVNARISLLAGELRSTQARLQEWAVAAYMDQAASSTGIIFSVGDTDQLVVALRYATTTAGSERELMEQLDAARRQMDQLQQTLLVQRDELYRRQAELDAQRQEADRRRDEVQRLAAEVAAERSRQVELLGQLDHQLADFDGELAALEREADRLERLLAEQQSGGGEAPSVMQWPVRGRISSPFGYRIHPITGAKKLHTGLDIAAPQGTPIGAAASGTVIFAGWFGSYGYTVIIDHGGGVATLYAHQSRVAVSKGETVAAGDVIGYVGSTGLSTGPHVHFEVRQQGTPTDPMPFL